MNPYIYIGREREREERTRMPPFSGGGGSVWDDIFTPKFLRRERKKGEQEAETRKRRLDQSENRRPGGVG